MTAEYRPLLLIIDDETALQSQLGKYLSYLGYRVETVPTGVEGIEAVRSLRPVALLVKHEMPGMTGLDFLDMVVGADMPAGPPAACYGARFGVETRKRAANVGRITLLEQNNGFAGAVVEWATGLLSHVQQPAAGEKLRGRKALDKAWRQIGKRRLQELGEVLSTQPRLSRQGSGWWTVSYDDVEASVYVGKDDRIALIRVED